jgi:hypothetical protein
MGCVHTHQGMPIIEGWGSLSWVWSVVEKNGEDNWKVKKTGQVVSQAFTLGHSMIIFEHDGL